MWWKYPGAIPCGPNRKCDGQSLVGPNYIIVNKAKVEDDRVVKHEMLHLLLGTGEHPPVFQLLNLGDH